jgi:hypothetical protein
MYAQLSFIGVLEGGLYRLLVDTTKHGDLEHGNGESCHKCLSHLHYGVHPLLKDSAMITKFHDRPDRCVQRMIRILTLLFHQVSRDQEGFSF